MPKKWQMTWKQYQKLLRLIVGNNSFQICAQISYFIQRNDDLTTVISWRTRFIKFGKCLLFGNVKETLTGTDSLIRKTLWRQRAVTLNAYFLGGVFKKDLWGRLCMDSLKRVSIWKFQKKIWRTSQNKKIGKHFCKKKH